MDAARFWAKVQLGTNDECWKWLGGCFKSGYGQPEAGKYAHRMAWELANNACIVPGKQNVIRHACDNKKCCNPAHLKLGSQAENHQDMDARGRRNMVAAWDNQSIGAARYNARLNDVKVAEIKTLLAEGISERQIAKYFQVSRGTISCIRRERTWRHIK